MSLADLPHEILAVILHITLDVAPVPSDILRACKLFRDLGADHLYTHLRFTSAHQLRQFVLSDASQPPIAPRSLAVDLTGKTQRGVLRDLSDALIKCRHLARARATVSDSNSDSDSGATARDNQLKRLRLRMHSYARDSAVDALERGLQAVR